MIERSGWKAFPPRLPEQLIFYPVVQEEYAVRIARDWNVPASGAGFVTRFDVDAEYLKQFPEQNRWRPRPHRVLDPRRARRRIQRAHHRPHRGHLGVSQVRERQ